jgi:hypothetical protein
VVVVLGNGTVENELIELDETSPTSRSTPPRRTSQRRWRASTLAAAEVPDR